MTDEDLAAIQARADAATPGPWRRGDPYRRATTHPPIDPKRDTCAYCDGYELLHTTNRKRHNDHVHVNWDDPWQPDHIITSDVTRYEVCGNYDYEVGGVIEAADSEFIAHARQDVVDLVAEVRRLRAGFDYGAYRQGWQDAMSQVNVPEASAGGVRPLPG